jgi:hypothetical protein
LNSFSYPFPYLLLWPSSHLLCLMVLICPHSTCTRVLWYYIYCCLEKSPLTELALCAKHSNWWQFHRHWAGQDHPQFIGKDLSSERRSSFHSLNQVLSTVDFASSLERDV